MLHFKNFGTTKIVASAPAITGFRAMQDTFEITYMKGVPRIHSKFKDQKVALGAVSETGLPDETINGAPVTYTYNGLPTSAYVTKNGEGFIAGNQNAIVAVTAHAPETATEDSLVRTVTFIIGDQTNAVNLEEYYAFLNPVSIKPVHKIASGLKASMKGSMLQFTTKNTGLVKLDVYDALGTIAMQQSDIYSAGSHAINLKGLPNGSYTLVIRQGSQKASLRWTNK